MQPELDENYFWSGGTYFVEDTITIFSSSFLQKGRFYESFGNIPDTNQCAFLYAYACRQAARTKKCMAHSGGDADDRRRFGWKFRCVAGHEAMSPQDKKAYVFFGHPDSAGFAGYPLTFSVCLLCIGIKKIRFPGISPEKRIFHT